MKYLIYTTLLFVVTSCSLNKIFLHPFELTADSHFQQYDEEKEDTLELNFTDKYDPIFSYQTKGELNTNYSLQKHFIGKNESDSLYAWYFKADKPNGKVIYYLHGNAAHLVYQYQLMLPFVEEGYNVFMIDYSGFGFSSGKATRKNTLEDAYLGFEYLQQTDSLLGDELIVYGQSLGGHLSVVSTKKFEEHVDLLVVEGAFSSHKQIAGERVKVLGRVFTREMYSAEDTIPSLNVPVLIIHSNEDTTIPISHGKHLYDLAAEPKLFYEVDQKHVLAPLYYADSIIIKMENLLHHD